MAINKCSNCGCEDSFLTSPAPCPTPAACPDPEPCYTVMDANCVTYSGPNIICDTNIVVAQNTPVSEGLQDIVNFFCSYEFNYDGPDILCNGDVVVASGVTVDQAIQDLGAFFCSFEPLYTGQDITCINANTGDTLSSVVDKLGTSYCEQILETPKAIHMTLAYSPIVSVFPWKNNTVADAWYRNSTLFIPTELLPTGKGTIRLFVTTEHNAGSDLRLNLYEVNSGTYLFTSWLTVTGTALDEYVSPLTYIDFSLLPGGASTSRWIEVQAYIENSAQFYHIDKIDIQLTPVL